MLLLHNVKLLITIIFFCSLIYVGGFLYCYVINVLLFHICCHFVNNILCVVAYCKLFVPTLNPYKVISFLYINLVPTHSCIQTKLISYPQIHFHK
jgi:hypothetical protein